MHAWFQLNCMRAIAIYSAYRSILLCMAIYSICNYTLMTYSMHKCMHLYCQIVPISFGSEQKTDPVEGVRFYTKDNPKRVIQRKDLKQEV